MNGSSVIGRTSVVRGNVRGSGNLEIHGRVEGDVSVSGELVLGDEAAVRGNVSATHVTVAGAVQGDVRASEAVLLERGARVVGDLTAPRVGVATGALVRGLVRTDGEPPLAGARRAGTPAARPAPPFAPRVQAVPRPEPAHAREEGVEDSEEQAVKEPKAGREAPPPPVVPTLAKGSKAKKKKKDD